MSNTVTESDEGPPCKRSLPGVQTVAARTASDGSAVPARRGVTGEVPLVPSVVRTRWTCGRVMGSGPAHPHGRDRRVW